MAGADSVEKLEDVIVRSAEQVAGQIRAAKDAISTVIFGQERVIDNTLVTILSGGHALLIGVPGLAKTKLVETLGITLGLDAKRIQFTPDLMPSAPRCWTRAVPGSGRSVSSPDRYSPSC
jgi:MoxR-like ATPase